MHYETTQIAHKIICEYIVSLKHNLANPKPMALITAIGDVNGIFSGRILFPHIIF